MRKYLIQLVVLLSAGLSFGQLAGPPHVNGDALTNMIFATGTLTNIVRTGSSTALPAVLKGIDDHAAGLDRINHFTTNCTFAGEITFSNDCEFVTTATAYKIVTTKAAKLRSAIYVNMSLYSDSKVLNATDCAAFFDTSGGLYVATLPLEDADGRICFIYNIGTNNLTVKPKPGYKLRGVVDKKLTLLPGEDRRFIYNATAGWW